MNDVLIVKLQNERESYLSVPSLLQGGTRDIRLLWQRRQDRGRPRTSGQGDPERSFQAFRRWQMLLARVREVIRRSREARAKSAT